MIDTPMVVALGASAGGIQAFRSFFEQVPPDSGMAYVVILHLSPDHESHLAEVLQTSSRIPVAVVRTRARLQRDHVYVVSPRQSLCVDDGELVAAEMQGDDERRAPVDMFFRTPGRGARGQHRLRGAVGHRRRWLHGPEARQGARWHLPGAGSRRGRARRHAAQRDGHRPGRRRDAAGGDAGAPDCLS